MSPRASEPRVTSRSPARGTTRHHAAGGDSSKRASASKSSGRTTARQAPSRHASQATGARAARSAGRGQGETPRARGERTRERVADALITLLQQGQVPPTARAVAARAGVSVRLVFHHFEDMDALYRKVVALQFARHWQQVRETPPDLPLEERIERTVAARAKLFDAVREVRRAARAASIRRPEIAARLEESDGLARKWLEGTFAPELAAAGRQRRELLAALDAAASWESWDRMRRSGGLSAAAARRSMARALHGLLEA